MKSIRVVFMVLGVTYLMMLHLFASTPEIYGISSRSAATAGLATFSNPDASFTYHNPAFLSQARQVSLHLGWFTAADFFEPIDNVVTQNQLTGESVARGNVMTDYPNLSGISFGLLLPMRKAFPKVSLGTAGFVPLGSLASIHTIETYVPVYTNYYTRPKRFSWLAGFAFEPIENLSIGAAANIYLTSGANTKINLNETNSVVSVAMDIVPAVAPIVGARYQWRRWGVDVAYLAPVDYAMTFQNKTELPLLSARGVDASIPIVEFLSQTSMFYDPQMIRVGVTHLLGGWLQLGLQGIWKNWTNYEVPWNHVEFINPGGIDSHLPVVTFRDTIGVGVGAEFPAGPFSIRGGYRYEPYHVISQEENSNLLDPDVHVVSSGLGFKVFESLFMDLHLQYHYLMPGRVEKQDTSAVGYRDGGYGVGGSLLNYGVTFGTTF